MSRQIEISEAPAPVRPELRGSDATRARLLDAAFDEMYLNGYQGLRVDGLLDKAGLTKGAFYHHFRSKQALGLAVVDEIFAGMVDLVWNQHLKQYDDPIAGIEATSQFALAMLGERCIKLGCPINNLAQEMSGIDEQFRVRLDGLFRLTLDHLAAALKRGKDAGIVRRNVDCDGAATFILASLEGAIGLAKSQRSSAVLATAMREYNHYLESLRAVEVH